MLLVEWFLNSDAGGRAGYYYYYYGWVWPARLKVEIAEDLRVFNSNNFPSKKLPLNGLQYHIQQQFIRVYARA